MFSWIIENLATIVICLALAAVVVLIIVGMVKNKRRGKTSCGGCQSCPMSGSCHRKM